MLSEDTRQIEGASDEKPMPLKGVRVVDAATLFAAPVIATLLGDFGADVIKVEHPDGDISRDVGWKKDGIGLGWAMTGRNKRSVTLKLSDPEGAEAMKRLLKTADILVENFRTGTLERWGLGWETLHALNPNLIVVHTTGFGQTGPYATQPGYGTLAEAMSGFAYMNGYPDGPPTLPPSALGDAVAALAGAFAVMAALRWRDNGGTGQEIDLAIYEPLFWVLSFGSQAVTAYDQLGIVTGRVGNRGMMGAPREIFQASDGKWLAVSAVHPSVADRVMRLVGRPDIAEQPWFASTTSRSEHHEEIHKAIADWVRIRSSDEVVREFHQAAATIALVMSVEDIFKDPQYAARETIATVQHPKLGPIKMPNVITKLSETPGNVRTCGPELGEHNLEILHDELGYSYQELQAMKTRNIVSNI